MLKLPQCSIIVAPPVRELTGFIASTEYISIDFQTFFPFFCYEILHREILCFIWNKIHHKSWVKGLFFSHACWLWKANDMTTHIIDEWNEMNINRKMERKQNKGFGKDFIDLIIAVCRVQFLLTISLFTISHHRLRLSGAVMLWGLESNWKFD